MLNNSILPLLLLLAVGGCNNGCGCANVDDCNGECAGNCAPCRNTDCNDLLTGCVIGMMCNNNCCTR